jgi:hypothetical protein
MTTLAIEDFMRGGNRRFYEGRQRVEPRGDNGVAHGVRGQPTGEVCGGHMCPKW